MSTGWSSSPLTPRLRAGCSVAPPDASGETAAAVQASSDQRAAIGAKAASSSSIRSSVSPPCDISGLRFTTLLNSAQPHSAASRER